MASLNRFKRGLYQSCQRAQALPGTRPADVARKEFGEGKKVFSLEIESRDKIKMAKAVTIQTSIGDVTLELYWNHAPKACHNFYELAKRGYYDNTIFHRIIKVRTKSRCPPVA
jgi:hypothetical protein